MKLRNTNIITQDGREVQGVAPLIVSVSRATDVPAFYADWFSGVWSVVIADGVIRLMVPIPMCR